MISPAGVRRHRGVFVVRQLEQMLFVEAVGGSEWLFSVGWGVGSLEFVDGVCGSLGIITDSLFVGSSCSSDFEVIL
ncbi:hypothetical protein WICPIJ_000225 [Wickerhamomyces pijperi]|uniref:Uncharacterized protein n=1 Tax=Wickerhamomyces pijperi TaxID=599730 RepID=A0A9P8QEB6_WICPI|nr:hypothetical protein WICPIJ_000225 [Wickerhamomyces pijperi]